MVGLSDLRELALRILADEYISQPAYSEQLDMCPHAYAHALGCRLCPPCDCSARL